MKKIEFSLTSKPPLESFFKGSAGCEVDARSLPDRPSRKRYKANALGK